MAGYPFLYFLNKWVCIRGERLAIIASLFILFILSSCQNNTDVDPSPKLTRPNIAGEESPIPPPVVITVASPSGYPSFEPQKSIVLSTPDLAQISPRTIVEKPYPVPPATEEIQPTTQPTDQPTFTPPASPASSPWDHYWFRRPVPEGAAVWTDKAYPYGSTRGGMLRTHHGVEFNVPSGTAIYASADGRVVFAGEDDEVPLGPYLNFYGRVIVIEHDFTLNNMPIYTLYGHLSEVIVEEDQAVKGGDLIAYSGSSGVADGPHLHFEVRIGENSYNATRNPILWLFPFPNRGVVAGVISGEDGSPEGEVTISLRRLDASSPYASTNTYAEGAVNGDDNWRENFAFDDVEAGYYALTIGRGVPQQIVELWVFPTQTNFVELTLQN